MLDTCYGWPLTRLAVDAPRGEKWPEDRGKGIVTAETANGSPTLQQGAREAERMAGRDAKWTQLGEAARKIPREEPCSGFEGVAAAVL